MLETGEQRKTEISHDAWSTDNYKCVLNNYKCVLNDFPLESPDSQHLSRRIKTTGFRASGPRTCLIPKIQWGFPTVAQVQSPARESEES